MTIITISRGSYSRGKEIAEMVAAKLGYECVGRDVLLETSEHFHIPEIKLVRAIHDAPSILDRFGYKKEKYIAFIRAAFLHHMLKDNVVYHGLAGHFFLKGISHVLKVRIIADWDDRIRLEMERENISEREAAQILKKDDEERRKWSKYLYGIDTSDANLYGLVIHIHRITPDLAAKLICETVQSKVFQTTPESSKDMEDLFIAAQVRVALVDQIPNCGVSSEDGIVNVNVRANLSQEEMIVKEVNEIASTVKGVKEIRVKISPRMNFST
ncbi:MAG: cytidylate kinase-like family protein [Planctomycetota bacterium]